MPSGPSFFDRLAGQAGNNGSGAAGKDLRLLKPLEARRLIWEQVPLVDARSAHDYLGYHLPGAVNVPQGAENEQIRRSLPDHRQPLIVYSNSNKRASTLALQLMEIGYSNVYLLGGGLATVIAHQDI